ncbi:metallophosphoesterase family protein [Parasulfitobacter algicola]|uniref:Metallophosphoesterase family protein n=1 Tax=Parasulfitobacter algicola TaxID=2614809 RepID=A0ABX2IUA7_9RHOB|nr:metallophosphoesterase [Sulfitobacter algicola]NSX56487.1 metallophosphoesterase family protein [Sulfitobacter algicola]
MKILAFSDLHLARVRAADLMQASAQADLVIGAGDFCNMRQGLPEAMVLLRDIKRPFVTVPGNAESADELRDAALDGMTVLHGQSVEIDGVTIFGIGYAIPVTPFGSWSCDLSEDTAEEMLNACGSADILVSHSPPKGVADITSAGQSVGSTSVRAAIERVQPKLMFCGHIHDSWGKSGQIGETQVHNLGPTVNWFEV